MAKRKKKKKINLNGAVVIAKSKGPLLPKIKLETGKD